MLSKAQAGDYIPFVGTERDCEILRDYYADSQIVRVSLFGSENTVPQLPSGSKLWVDAGIDALDRWPVSSDKFRIFAKGFVNCEQIADPAFQIKPSPVPVRQFVDSVLNACLGLRPLWLSIPQLPVTADSARNKINRELAEASHFNAGMVIHFSRPKSALGWPFDIAHSIIPS